MSYRRVPAYIEAISAKLAYTREYAITAKTYPQTRPAVPPLTRELVAEALPVLELGLMSSGV